MRIQLGYPDTEAERILLEGRERRDMIADLAPVLSAAELIQLQKRAREVFAAPALLDYVQALISYTRECADFVTGLSPRAGLFLLNAARAWAFMDGRREVIPEDVQAVLPSVAEHRLHSVNGLASLPSAELAQRLIEEVAIP